MEILLAILLFFALYGAVATVHNAAVHAHHTRPGLERRRRRVHHTVRIDRERAESVGPASCAALD